ncbi:MAG: hypothetical protein WCC84_09795 [Candidatus Cybelea sp.]
MFASPAAIAAMPLGDPLTSRALHAEAASRIVARCGPRFKTPSSLIAQAMGLAGRSDGAPGIM